MAERSPMESGFNEPSADRRRVAMTRRRRPNMVARILNWRWFERQGIGESSLCSCEYHGGGVAKFEN
ncbi:hypothetical protein HJC23_004704 [Cyclotella cryptica]|uniref:Uncharacterized protein n=1 Tax=Cyclotella cryptica TaxID=29204 RepID=A0ABD3PSI6_9STRA